ncbi:hypothetical protein Bca101_101482 [Brassica carinata]
MPERAAEETLVEARSDTDANRSPDLGRVAALLSHPTESRAPSGPFLVSELAMRDEPKPGYGAQLRANLEPTKGVGRLRQQDGGHGSRNPLRRGRAVAAKPRARARRSAAGADLGGSSKYSNENFEGRRGESLPTPETAQPEVGSSGWKSTARRVVSVHSRALENPEDRKPPRPVALITASGLQVQPADCWRLLEPLTWRATASCRPGTDWERLFRAFPRRTANSELCSECQSEEIQPSAVNGGVTMTLLRDNWLVAAKPLIATLLFDPSMSALPIIVKQNSPSVGLFTHQ